MKLPVLKQSVPEQGETGKKPGPLVKKLLRRRVVIPVLACVLAGTLALRLAGGGQPASAAGKWGILLRPGGDRDQRQQLH